MSDRETDLIDVTLLGEEAKKFIASDLGQTLLARARQDTLSALEELGQVDPSDTKAITALQNRAALGRMFPEWLQEIISIGEDSLTIWKKEQHGEA